MHIVSCFVLLKSILLTFYVFMIFFSEHWQSTLFLIFFSSFSHHNDIFKILRMSSLIDCIYLGGTYKLLQVIWASVVSLDIL